MKKYSTTSQRYTTCPKPKISCGSSPLAAPAYKSEMGNDWDESFFSGGPSYGIPSPGRFRKGQLFYHLNGKLRLFISPRFFIDDLWQLFLLLFDFIMITDCFSLPWLQLFCSLNEGFLANGFDAWMVL